MKEVKIAVQNPIFLLMNQKKNFNGYDFIFFKKYVKFIFLTDYKRLFKYFFTINLMKKKGIINKDIKIILNPFKLSKTEILIGFSGRPDKFMRCLPRMYKGMKVYHIKDFHFNPTKSNINLLKSKIDYLLGYTNHYKYSCFFRKYYSSFEKKIISLPFGYGDRFSSVKNFNIRINKAIALGSLKETNDLKNSVLSEYENFYIDERFTHKLRRKIVKNRRLWNEWIEDILPTFPQNNNRKYDPSYVLNSYKMFVNDASILNFPPARTYEGIASGCVMVAEDLELYRELGFIDGYNCILFEKENYNEMIEKIDFYIKNPEKLYNLHKNSLELSKKYSHKKVADYLYNKLIEKYLIWKEEKSGNNCS